MNEDKELEEAVKHLKQCSKLGIVSRKEAIETVLQELKYVKNDEQKALQILKENSIGRYKRKQNGIETYIIAVADFKKILNLIDTQEIKLKNSIPKKKIRDKIKAYEKLIDDISESEQYSHEIPLYKHDIQVLQELLENK